MDDRAHAPKQGDEGAPDAWIRFEPHVLEALNGLRAGMDVLVITWLDRADRYTLEVYPRDDMSRPKQGVFTTRSADRPNPIGLHRVQILSIDGERMHVRNLEAIDQTPVVDIKPLIGPINER